MDYGISPGAHVRVASGLDKGRVGTVTDVIPEELCEAPGTVWVTGRPTHCGAWDVPSATICDTVGRPIGRFPVTALEPVRLATYEPAAGDDRDAVYMRAFRRHPVTGTLLPRAAFLQA